MIEPAKIVYVRFRGLAVYELIRTFLCHTPGSPSSIKDLASTKECYERMNMILDENTVQKTLDLFFLVSE